MPTPTPKMLQLEGHPDASQVHVALLHSLEAISPTTLQICQPGLQPGRLEPHLAILALSFERNPQHDQK